MDEITQQIEQINIQEDHMISYIEGLQIDPHTKELLLHLVYNDNYNDYMQIYTICMENQIELPPL